MTESAYAEEIPIEFTLITNDRGAANKTLSVGPDGKLKKVSAGDIWSGEARRIRLRDWRCMAEFLPRLQSDQVITLGTMREGLGDLAHLTTKSNKAELAKPFRFARTRDNLLYLPGVPAPCAIDFDTGGITQSVTDKIAECGGLLGAIEYLCPDFKSAAYLSRGSSTAGLTFTETGEVYPGGEHHLVILADGSQSKQFIDVMFDRAWLAGMGWIQVGLGGQLMTRSIFDRCVWDAARLLFEADPTLGPGLTQAPRTVTVHDGGRLSFVRLP